jgi:hypothetical protein
VVFGKSTTSGLMLNERFGDFDPSSFVAGLIRAKGACLGAKFPPEVLVEGGQWSWQELADIRETLEPTDIVVKSANVYDGKKAAILVMSPTTYGTLGVILPDLYSPSRGERIRAVLFCPVTVERLVPEGSLAPLPHPDKSYGQPARVQVFEPDIIFDERGALRVLLGVEAAVVAKGSTIEGLATTTFQIDVPAERDEEADALVKGLLSTPPIVFRPRECGPACDGCEWGK